jgi:hypothetical protein
MRASSTRSPLSALAYVLLSAFLLFYIYIYDGFSENSTNIVAKNETIRKIPNSSCHRFSHMVSSRGDGLGHKFGEVVQGMMLAHMTNTTFVYDLESWSFEGDHGGYEWFPEFLPLEETVVTLTDIKDNNISLMKVEDTFLNLVSRSKGELKDSCNLIFMTSWAMCDGNCFTSSRIGGYNDVKWRFREVYSRSKFQPSTQIFKNCSSQGSLSVAWHLRGGDIVLHPSEDFYQNLASELKYVLQDLSYHIFFFGEFTEAFPFISHFCETVFPGHCSFHQNVSNADTLYHFVVADVLVTSGSSFPIAASIFRSLPQPTFSVMPKENSRSFYFMSEEILVDETGHLNDNVSKDDIMSQIHEYVRTKTKLFPLKQKSKLVKWIM